MPNFEVRVSNIFEADTPEDAVLMMVNYLLDNVGVSGYHVYMDETGENCGFYDAEELLNGA